MNINKNVISSATWAALVAFAAITTLTAPSVASAATDMKCGCYAPLEANIAAANPTKGDPSYKLNCESNDRFTTTGTAVSVQKGDLKVYVDAKNAVQGDNDMNISFRSRNEQFLNGVYEANGNNRWLGAANDNNEIEVGGFSISGGGGSWTAGFKGDTSGKDYKGVVLFSDLTAMNINPGKKTMTALCLQDH